MASIFTRIVNGEIPCYKIAENEHCLAFLDIMPLAKGHTLVIPKKEVDYIYDLDDNLLSELHLFAKNVAKKIEKAMPCERAPALRLDSSKSPLHTTSPRVFDGIL